MDKVIVWFILTGGTGYIEPQEVTPAQMTCALPGTVVGVQIDKPVNPSLVLWPDPKTVGQHCRVDIAARVATLKPGEYHIATTIVAKTRYFGSKDDKPEPYIQHDPHTTANWRRGDANTPGKPGPRFRVVRPQ